MKRWAILGGLFLTMSALGCATNNPPAPPPLEVVPQSVADAEPTPAPPKGEDLLGQQPSEVQAAVKQHHQDGAAWQVLTTDRSQLYPYGEGPEPVIDCEPLRSTDLQLQAGETITDVVMGDSERWQATPAASGDPRNPVPHVAIKPQVPGIKTNLAIYTTRHIYHLILRSRPGHSVEEVEFYYPDELLAAMKDADEAAKHEQQSQQDPSDGRIVVASLKSTDPAALNFSYKIDGPNAPWRPLRAFDDGTHVYIQMPPGMKTSDAPALLVGAADGNQMVNYRVRGNYYVVDRLFESAVLVAGVGREQDRVTVAYTGGPR